jgi:putative ABC transport system ATP-binding protein
VPEPRLAVEQVSVAYGPPRARVRAVDDVTLEFAPATLTVIMGPSGSGKTTLLSLLGALLRPDEGRVFVDGIEIEQLTDDKRTELRREKIGFVFQAFRLFHALSAFENVMIAADVAFARDKAVAEQARRQLSRLGLSDKLQLKPKELSGGEKQRVAIARALLRQPKVLLADEPTASLDSTAGRQICEILRRLSDDEQCTVVVVSHDLRWAQFAHRTVILEDGRVLDDRMNTG